MFSRSLAFLKLFWQWEKDMLMIRSSDFFIIIQFRNYIIFFIIIQFYYYTIWSFKWHTIWLFITLDNLFLFVNPLLIWFKYYSLLIPLCWDYIFLVSFLNLLSLAFLHTTFPTCVTKMILLASTTTICHASEI